MVNLVQKYWLWLLLALSGLPGLALLLRNSVWGSDSFAYWAVSCGSTSSISAIHSPPAFVWFIQNIIHCNLFVLAFVMWFLYFFALLGVYFFGKRLIPHKSYRLPFYLATLTPLFFIEALRFEQEFFGWTFALIALGLFSLIGDGKNEF